MFKIYDGRESFYQWDLDRKLIVNDATINQVHFCNRMNNCSLKRNVYEVNGMFLVDVPNVVLQESYKLNVYGYDKNYTKHSDSFKILPRSKPEDYVFTDAEVNSWEVLEERVAALEQGGTGGGGSADLTGYATEAYVDEKIAAIEIPDVSAFALKSEIPDVSAYQTEAQVEAAINAALDAIGVAEESEY